MRSLALAALLFAAPAFAQSPPRVGPLFIQNGLGEIAASGSGAQSTARGNLGLGTAATQPSTAFDAAGLAAAEASRATAAEAVVAGSVASEVTRALAAEGANATAAAAAQTTANAAVPKAGGTMTGALILSGAPTVALNPSTKAYADAETTRATAAEGTNATAITSEATTARANEATNATAAAAAQTTANAALPKAGGTMTGALHMGAQTIDGSAVAFTGGTIAGATITGGSLTGANVTINGTQQTLGAAIAGATGCTSNCTAAITSGTISGAALAAMKCDGITDDTAAFASAVATGSQTVFIPVTSAGCIVSGTVVPQSGQTITGLGGTATISLVSGSVGQLVNLTGLNHVTLTNLKLVGTSAAAGFDFVRFYNTTYSKLTNAWVVNPPGSTNGCILLAQASTDNEISENIITGCASTAIIGNNANVTRNKIHHNTISGAAAFSIRFMSGANRNEISSNIIAQSGIEPIAISLGAQYNRVIGNHVEGSGDNGISIVGDHNIISHNEVVKNAKAGIYLWGGNNTVVGNNLLDNNLNVAGWPCIGAATNYGATGSYNTITNNTCDDDQVTPTQLGITINTGLPTLWSTGLGVTSGQFVYYGLNNYLAGGTGTTGATAPTCTSGTCSDGTITWTYQSSWLTQAGSFFNTIQNNNIIRWAGTAPYVNVPQPSDVLNRNPDFLVSQLFQNNATPSSNVNNALMIDGWRWLNTNNNQIVAQRVSSSIPGYPSAELLTAQSNFTVVSTSQFTLIDRIEAARFAPLGWGTSSAQPLTLDLCAMLHGVTGPVAISLDNGGSGASFTTYLTTVNVTVADTWQCFSQNIAGATTGVWGTTPGSIGGRLGVTLGAGSTFLGVQGWQTPGASGLYGLSGMVQVVATSGASLRLAAVHLYRAGSQIIPRNYETELALAQRWFWTSFSNTTAIGQSQGLTGAYCTTNPVAAGQPSLFIAPSVKMYGTAANIVVTTYNPSAANANWRDVTASSDVTVNVDPASAKGANGIHLTTTGTVATQGDTLCIHAAIDSGL